MGKQDRKKTNQQPRTPAGAPHSVCRDSSDVSVKKPAKIEPARTERDRMFGIKLQPLKVSRRHWKAPSSPSSASSVSVGEPRKKSARFFGAPAQVRNTGPLFIVKVTPEKTYAEVAISALKK